MLLWLGISLALGAKPTPDRPYVSRTGFLVEENTLEQELGLQFAEQRSVPSTLKYAIEDLVEVRMTADLGAVREGTPGLEAGVKVRLLETKQDGLALWASSKIPVQREQWQSQVHALFATVLTRELRLRLNGGIDLVGSDNGIVYAGTPVTGALTLKPFNRIGVFGEFGGRFGDVLCDNCAFGSVFVNGGARIGLTEHLAGDVAGGYRFQDRQPYLTMGLTANFGRFQ